MKRLFAIVLVLGLGMWCAPAAERPSVVFILVDDLGVNDIGIEGSTFYETPNIDRLASSGMRFRNGYAACRVCSPSRASIMLGKAPPRHGITNWIGARSGDAYKRNDPVMPANYVRNLPAEDSTLAEALQAAGYRTFFAGKWHLGGEGSWPEDHGFEINKGGWSSGGPRGGYFAPWQNPRLESGPIGQALPLRLAEETAAFIRGNRDRPFLAYLSFYLVHGPIQTSEALCAKYRTKARREGLTANDTRFTFDRRLPVRQVQDNPIYAGMMETLDDAVGIVLDALADTGLDKTTVVMFTGDNGGVSSGDAFSTSLLPLRGGKGRQWEGGIREPYSSAPATGSSSTTTKITAWSCTTSPTTSANGLTWQRVNRDGQPHSSRNSVPGWPTPGPSCPNPTPDSTRLSSMPSSETPQPSAWPDSKSNTHASSTRTGHPTGTGGEAPQPETEGSCKILQDSAEIRIKRRTFSATICKNLIKVDRIIPARPHGEQA